MAACCPAPALYVSRSRHVKEHTTGGLPGGFSTDGIPGYHTVQAHDIAEEVTCMSCGTVQDVRRQDDFIERYRRGGYCLELTDDGQLCNGRHGHDGKHSDRNIS